MFFSEYFDHQEKKNRVVYKVAAEMETNHIKMGTRQHDYHSTGGFHPPFLLSLLPLRVQAELFKTTYSDNSGHKAEEMLQRNKTISHPLPSRGSLSTKQ